MDRAVFDAVASHIGEVRPEMAPKVMTHVGWGCYVVEVTVSNQFWFLLELKGEEYRPNIYGRHSTGISSPDYLGALVERLDEFKSFYDTGVRAGDRLAENGLPAVTQLLNGHSEYSMVVKLTHHDLIVLVQTDRRGVRYQVSQDRAYDNEDDMVADVLKAVPSLWGRRKTAGART